MTYSVTKDAIYKWVILQLHAAYVIAKKTIIQLGLFKEDLAF